MTADIPGLLIGVDNDVREIGYKLYKWIGDPNRMQYPNAARFAKIPAEVFTVCKFIFFFLIHSSFIFSSCSSS
jgi:hypothetical protein